MAPATWTSGVKSEPWLELETTPTSPGAMDGNAAAAALLMRIVTLKLRLALAGTVIDEGNDNVAPMLLPFGALDSLYVTDWLLEFVRRIVRVTTSAVVPPLLRSIGW